MRPLQERPIAAPRRAAFSSSPWQHIGSLRGTWSPHEKQLMAVQRQRAAHRVEIERAIDAVKGTKSNSWFRAVLHQGVLCKVGRGRGPRIVDDEGRVIRERNGEGRRVSPSPLGETSAIGAGMCFEPRGVLSEARR